MSRWGGGGRIVEEEQVQQIISQLKPLCVFSLCLRHSCSMFTEAEFGFCSGKEERFLFFIYAAMNMTTEKYEPRREALNASWAQAAAFDSNLVRSSGAGRILGLSLLSAHTGLNLGKTPSGDYEQLFYLLSYILKALASPNHEDKHALTIQYDSHIDSMVF